MPPTWICGIGRLSDQNHPAQGLDNTPRKTLPLRKPAGQQQFLTRPDSAKLLLTPFLTPFPLSSFLIVFQSGFGVFLCEILGTKWFPAFMVFLRMMISHLFHFRLWPLDKWLDINH